MKLLTFVLCTLVLCEFETSAAQSSSSSSTPASTSSSSTSANSSTPSSSSQSSSSLQSEAKVLTYYSITDGMNALLAELDAKFKKTTAKPIFVLNLPFAPDDVASLWELKRQINNVNSAITDALNVSNRNLIDAEEQKMRSDFPGLSASASGTTGGGGGGSSTTFSGSPTLAGIGSDATSVGMAISTISSLLAIAQNFHSPYTTTTGALGLDQPTINSMLVTRLYQDGYTVSDFTQMVMTETDYLPKAAVAGRLPTLLQETIDLHDNVNQLNVFIAANSDTQTRIANDLKSLQDRKKSMTDDQTISSTDIANFNTLNKEFNALLGLYNEDSVLLKAACTFQVTLNGPVTLNYPAPADKTGNSQNTNPAPTPVVISGTNAPPININLSLPASTQASSQSSQGSSSPSAPTSTSINLVEKYAFIESVVDTMEYTKAPVYVVSCRAIIGDATESKVTRFLLEDYVALSNRAVVQLQIYDPLQASYIYANEIEHDHSYVYFPSRIRDTAENTDKSTDKLAQPTVAH